MEHFFVANKSNQLISNLYRTDSSRCTRVDEVSFFECEKLGYIGNDGRKIKKHQTGISFLLQFPVDLEVEVDVFQISQLGNRFEFTNGSGSIECFRNLPRQPFGLALVLKVSCCKIYPQTDFLKIAVRKLRLYVFSFLANFEYQFDFVVDIG